MSDFIKPEERLSYRRGTARRAMSVEILSTAVQVNEQEGQHPLTAQRAATCFQWGSVPLRSDIKGTELSPGNILIPLEMQFITLQLCR